jgi:Tol biopolymer transport system component
MSPATAKPGGDRIVYSKQLPHGGATVATLRPDGSGSSDLPVQAPLEDFNKSTWSHDATRLLFSNVLVFDKAGELVAFRPAVSAADGSDYRLLRMRWRPGDFYCSAWSLDDTRILCSLRGGVVSVRVSDGRGARSLTDNPYGGNDLAVGYSPDGTRLAWLRERPDPRPDDDVDGEREALFVGDADGSHPRRLTPWRLLQAHEFAAANWSPDGTRIVSTTRQGRIVEIDAATGDVHAVPLALGKRDFAVMPDYSPDGQRVVFAMFRGAPSDLFVANLDGTGLTRITRTSSKSELSPDWSRLP